MKPLIAALGVVWIASCHAPPEPDRYAPQRFTGPGFALTLRKDVRHSTLTPTPSLTLYDFHIGSQALLFAYAGDKPGYPHFAEPPEREEELVLRSGLHARCRETSSTRECLIALGDDSPKKLHLWYEKLDPALRKAADSIIESARRH